MRSDEPTPRMRAGHEPAIERAPGAVARPRSDEHGVAPDWHGITLVHRGCELGVVGHVSRGGFRSERVLHALGGVSRSLEYAVPESAIVGVFGVSARALVDDGLEFEPQHLCGDGRVILVPRTQRGWLEARDDAWRSLPAATWVGIRTYADDGYLGDVDAVIPSSETGQAEFLIVCARVRMWKTRLPVIPVARIVACTPGERVARLTGTRHELASMSERPPDAHPRTQSAA